FWRLFANCRFWSLKVTMAKEILEKELDHIFREDLMVACQYWDIDVSGSTSGTQLSKLLAVKMKKKANRERIFATFTPGERDLLGMLALSGGAMSYDRLKPYRKIYSYGQLNQTERDLRKKGLIIRRMMSRLTEFGREVAEFKILDFFIPHLKDYFTAKPEPDPTKPVKIKSYVDERDSLLIDMLLLSAYLAKNEVRMTSSWEFPKREIDHIKEAMSSPTEERFELVQKVARKAGVYSIIEQDNVRPSNIDRMFAGKQEDVSKRILLSALGRTRAIWATPDQPTEYTMNLAICRLRESTQEEWIRVEEMRDWIRSELFIESQPLKWIQVDVERVRMALETPITLGLVEAAYKGKKLMAIRLTEVGEVVISKGKRPDSGNQETFFVLPNFELTVFTSEMDYSKLYKLMLFSEPIKTDVVSTFRITDSSIFQAIEIGFRENEILEFMETESSKPIPKNVTRSIKDWTSQTTFATMSEVVLFETESEEDMEGLLLIPDFSNYVIRRVGPAAVIVSSDSETMGEDLRRHKINIKKKEKQMPVEEPVSTLSATEQMLIYGDGTVTDVPEACVGCPAVQSCNRVIRRKTDAKRGS
ncbi:MAG: helicase-associated domain-containing protein, partial [Candidatus Thorarchaeota archaeon]